MCGHRYSEVTCTFSLIKFLTSVPFLDWKRTARLKVHLHLRVQSKPKHEVAIIEREFKFRKRIASSVLGSLKTDPLHSTLAVNNLGLKFVS